MLKLGKIYIHFLTVAMFILFFLNGHIGELCISYGSMLLHELSHTLAAYLIGLKISQISLYPFGVNLKLKNKIVASISEEILLYLCGPAVNVVISLASLYLSKSISSELIVFCYRVNTVLFFMNILPLMPLDGGCILKRIISGIAGSRIAVKIIKGISLVIAIMLFGAGLYIIRKTGYNYTAIVISVFMIGNIFTQREKYNTEYIRELMFYRDKPLKHIKLSAAYADSDYRDIAKSFLPLRYSIVCTIDKNGKIKDFKSEKEIIENILKEK